MAFDADKYNMMCLDCCALRNYGTTSGIIISIIETLALSNRNSGLREYYRDGLWCAPISARRISSMTGFSVSCVKAHLKMLREKGVVRMYRIYSAYVMYTVPPTEYVTVDLAKFCTKGSPKNRPIKINNEIINKKPTKSVTTPRELDMEKQMRELDEFCKRKSLSLALSK